MTAETDGRSRNMAAWTVKSSSLKLKPMGMAGRSAFRTVSVMSVVLAWKGSAVMVAASLLID